MAAEIAPNTTTTARAISETVLRRHVVRGGGTLPIMPALQDKGIPTILTGFALPESNVHSPNERMLVEFFPRGLATMRELFTRLGDLS